MPPSHRQLSSLDGMPVVGMTDTGMQGTNDLVLRAPGRSARDEADFE